MVSLDEGSGLKKFHLVFCRAIRAGPDYAAGSGREYKWSAATRAMREKSLSMLKRIAPCSRAIAAINESIVVRLMPFDLPRREIVDASRYVEKPRGSIISHKER